MSATNNDTSVQERVGAARAAIEAILVKYHCVIDASVVIAKGQITPSIFIEALPYDPAPEIHQPASESTEQTLNP